ncbi:MAG: FAD-binding oxidoreductase [Gammaproteobacteria bacterium]|nr:FAD-binding oxidoreductase [Gammaproteobacteria bacterium]
MEPYEVKKQALIAQLAGSGTGGVRLGKPTSNLFRDRDQATGAQLNVRNFNNVLGVEPVPGWVEVEGMTPYETAVDATLNYGVMPTVVPQLKSITVGGAVSGVGIESSSVKFGLVHETVQEMEVLTGAGEVVLCTPHNDHRDLFRGLPNSYGTLGYILKLKVKTTPVKPYVRLQHIRHTDPESYFREIEEIGGRDIDFLDGVVFAPNEMYITVGNFEEQVPYSSDYTFEKIYYHSIRERHTDHLTTRNYLWRWDTDWFWCSKNLLAQNPIMRRIYGPARLNSVFYTRIMRWNAKWRVSGVLNRALGYHTESVIQDVDIPIDHAPEFLRFFDTEIGIRPIWICPIRSCGEQEFSLYSMDADKMYINFGFWDVVREREKRPAGFYNRKVEAKVEALGGIKSLYSDSYYTREKFWELYNRDTYQTLKGKYDPDGRFDDLYRKCVLRK